MQKILLISFMSFLFLNVYSQNITNNSEKNIKDQYKNQITIDEKLDYIYEMIIGKQISDFIELKSKNEKLKRMCCTKETSRKQLESKTLELERIQVEKTN